MFQYQIRLLDDLFAQRSRVNAGFGAFKQGYTEFVFQFFHTHRQGRLADVAALSGMAEVLLLGEGNDVA